MDVLTITRKCTTCKINKPIDCFHKDKTRKYGFRHVCKKCTVVSCQKQKYKEKRAAYNDTDAGKSSRKKYRQSEKGRLAIVCGTNIKKLLYPEQYKARRAVMREVERGNIPQARMHKCRGFIDCVKNAEVYHHHLGYAQEHWLDIQPVCKKCHVKLHQKT